MEEFLSEYIPIDILLEHAFQKIIGNPPREWQDTHRKGEKKAQLFIDCEKVQDILRNELVLRVDTPNNAISDDTMVRFLLAQINVHFATLLAPEPDNRIHCDAVDVVFAVLCKFAVRPCFIDAYVRFIQNVFSTKDGNKDGQMDGMSSLQHASEPVGNAVLIGMSKLLDTLFQSCEEDSNNNNNHVLVLRNAIQQLVAYTLEKGSGVFVQYHRKGNDSGAEGEAAIRAVTATIATLHTHLDFETRQVHWRAADST